MRRFRDREEAGALLADALEPFAEEDAVVYALPRGGVVVGYQVAKKLGLPLDIVVARKVGHPANPEFAVCAVTEEGEMFCNESVAHLTDRAWLAAAARGEQEEARRRRKAYLPREKHIPASGKTAILVDDGVATGLTLRAALHALRKERPAKIVVAVPVAPHDVVEELEKEADEVVVLLDEAHYLGAVGAYYEDFPQTTDDEVISLLADAHA